MQFFDLYHWYHLMSLPIFPISYFSCSFFCKFLPFPCLFFSDTKILYTMVKYRGLRSTKLIQPATFRQRGPKVKSSQWPRQSKIPNKKIFDFVNVRLHFHPIRRSFQANRSLFEISEDCSFEVEFKGILMLVFSCPFYECLEFLWFGMIGLLQSIKWLKFLAE
jgi:hypothetical protein